MNSEEIREYISVVKGALNKIYLAEKIIDKRKRDKAIHDAKVDAKNMVYPYKTILTSICHMENLGDELFDWGRHIESDLQRVYAILKDLYNQNKETD